MQNMKAKHYTVSKDKQSGYINTECKPVTELVTKCIICGNDVVISMCENSLKVCEDCVYEKVPSDKKNLGYCILHRYLGKDICVDGIIKYFENK